MEITTVISQGYEIKPMAGHVHPHDVASPNKYYLEESDSANALPLSKWYSLFCEYHSQNSEYHSLFCKKGGDAISVSALGELNWLHADTLTERLKLQK